LLCTCCHNVVGIQSGSLVTSLSGTPQVLATAILNGQLFVTRFTVTHVLVYETMSYQLLRQINLAGVGTRLFGLAASTTNNYLYVSDLDNNCVHRVDLSATSTVSVVTWSAPGGPCGLSMTSDGNVLVATYSNGMQEYTPSGSLVRSIANSNHVWHAVEVNNGIWAFTVNGPMNGICTTLTNGTLIKCYGSAAGPAITQMNDPRSLAVGTRGYIFVADRQNNRILAVDPSLTGAHQLPLLQLNTAMTKPMALTFDASRGRLYVGEDPTQQRVLVFGGIW